MFIRDEGNNLITGYMYLYEPLHDGYLKINNFIHISVSYNFKDPVIQHYVLAYIDKYKKRIFNLSFQGQTTTTVRMTSNNQNNKRSEVVPLGKDDFSPFITKFNRKPQNRNDSTGFIFFNLSVTTGFVIN